MTPLDESLEHIIDPQNFVKNFADLDQFKWWCRTGDIKDLMDAIKVYEKHDLFEHCRIMQDVIDEKVDKMLGFN